MYPVSNISFADEENPFGDLNLRQHFNESTNTSSFQNSSYGSLFTEVGKILLNIASALACFLLIYTMIKFKNLRIGAHLYILHYAICAIFVHILLTLEIIYELTMFEDDSASWILCVFYQTNITLITLTFCFAMATALDWCLVSFGWLDGVKRRNQGYLLACIYTLVGIKYGLVTSECFSDEYLFTNYLGIIIYAINFILVLCITVAAKVKRLNGDDHYLLIISCCQLATWLPLYIFDVIFVILDGVDDDNIDEAHLSVGLLDFVEFAGHLSEFIAFSTPLIVVTLLAKLNRHFSVAYSSVLKKNLRNYQSDNLEKVFENAQDIESNNTNTAQN